MKHLYYIHAGHHKIDNPEMFTASTSISAQSTSELGISKNNHCQPRIFC